MKKIIFVLLFFACSVFAVDKVNINTASLEQLDQITGIGPAIGQRIIDARPFSSVDDLLKVKGIGEKTLQKIKDQGLACVGCEPTQEISNSQLPISNELPITNNSITYPTGVKISEVMASPEGPDEENEYIKLYNENAFEVDLTGWKLEDTVGTKTTYILNNKIPAKEYLILTRPETKITLNNSGETVKLLYPNGEVADSSSYTAPAKTPVATKTKTAVPTTAAIAEALPITEKSDISISNKVVTANPWFLFFIAIAITIVSAVLVIFIKLKLKTNVRS